MGPVRLVYRCLESLSSGVRSKTCRLPLSVPTQTCDSPTTAIQETSESEKLRFSEISVVGRLGTGTGIWSTCPFVESSIPIENPGPPWIKCLWYDHGIELVGLLANTLSKDSVGETKKSGEDWDSTGDCKIRGGFVDKAVSGTA